MESLYTKYRPQTFEQVVGQKHVVETLKRAIVDGKTSHAYLFCGPRGTGKTTMARLLAKALMCEQGPGQMPDGTCEQCRLIAAGEHPDVAELDAASRTGVDNVRDEILSRVNYAPTMGRCKVYIIDEVHMLTPAAFNALLKTLEEPPEHVVFIMCTTDPQKILATILSRVQRFDFHAIAPDEMQAHLAYVCGREGFTYDDAALELVVRHARGGMRDALTSLEQLSVFGNGHIGIKAAQDFLGEVSGSVLGNVGMALAQRDVPTLFGEVEKLMESGRDLLQFTRELAAHVRDVYVCAVAPGVPGVVSASGEALEALREEAAAFGSPDRLARVLTVLGDASAQMRTATNQRLVLEIALTRIARPESDLTLESLADRLATLEQRLTNLAAEGVPAAAPVNAPALAPSAPTAVATPAPQTPERTLQPAPHVTPAAAPSPAQPAPTPQPEQKAPTVAPAPLQPRAVAPRPEAIPPAAAAPDGVAASPNASRAASEARSAERRAIGGGGDAGGSGPSTGKGLSDAALQRAWRQVVDTLKQQQPAKGSILLSSRAVSDDGETLTIGFPAGSRFAMNMFGRGDVRAVIEPQVAAVFGVRKLTAVEEGGAKPAAPRSASPAPAPPARSAAPARTAAPQPAQAPQYAAAQPPVQPAAPAPVPDYDQVPTDAYEGFADPAAANDYPMPWDAPTAAPSPQQPATSPQPAQAPQNTPANPGRAPEAAPMPAGAGNPSRSVDASREASEARSAERRATNGAGGVPSAGGPAVPPQDLPPVFSELFANLAEAFGKEPVVKSFESAADMAADDAAADVPYDDDAAPDDAAPEGSEFADEPTDDADAEE